MSDTLLGIDVEALRALIADNPEEFRALLDEVEPKIEDRYGRSIHKTDRVTMPSGEAGMVIRVDKKTKRVLIETYDGRTRLLRSHRVEVARGRPRKDSLRVLKTA